MRKEYIQPSKLPQTVPVFLFFVGKKDGKKIIVQDYQYLNEGMVKQLSVTTYFEYYKEY